MKRKYREGEYVFFQGDRVENLYFLEMGKVEIFKSDINGKKLTLWFIGEEEIFCLANLYAPMAFATAKVVCDSMLYSIDKDYFDSLAGRSGTFSRNLVRCMSTKLMSYSRLLDDIAFKRVEARLAKILLQRMPLDEQSGFTCNFSHEEMAALAGTSREVVGRCLKSFRDRGLIRKQSKGRKRCLVIENFSAMSAIAEAE